MTKNWFPKPQKIDFFQNRFFDVLVVAKRRRRLEFWRRVALDFPDDPERPNDEQNRIFSTVFFENFEKLSKKNQKISRSLVSQILFATGGTIDLLINWSTSELNTLLDPTTYLDYTDCWIQLVTAPTMAVTSWIQLSTCILISNWTGGARPSCASRW